MKLATGNELGRGLRALTKNVRRRLWISSPFIGGWDAATRLLDRGWREKTHVDVRLLTDIENVGWLHPATINEFETHGQIKHLRGLHAKVFIVDDRALVTSANLTRTAFAQRYEVGVFLTKPEAQAVITLFDQWWEKADIPPDGWAKELKVGNRKGSERDEPTASPLKTLSRLPPSPAQNVHDGVRFGDYVAFLKCYRDFARQYGALQRLWPSVPLYLETDAFLNFLFHDAPRRPSKRFEKLPPRNLGNKERARELKKHAASFAQWVHRDPGAETYRSDRRKRWRTVQRVLDRQRIRTLSRKEIESVILCFHCMKAIDINRARFLNPANNNLPTIRKAWANVLYPDSNSLESGMRQCLDSLVGFGKSSVQELLGWFDPKRYPIRNANSNSGLRFFGYKVSVR